MQKLKAIIEPKSFDHAREELTVLVERKVGKADIEIGMERETFANERPF